MRILFIISYNVEILPSQKKLKEKDHVRRNKFLENNVKMNLSRKWIW